MNRTALAGLLAVVPMLTASAQRVVEPWGNVFAKSQPVFHVEAPAGPAAWSFAVAGAVVARGDFQSAAAVTLDVPDTKPGVVLEASLTVEAGGKSHSHRLWIFPSDPWTDRKESLKRADLHVFDPDGRTVDELKKLNVPFQTIGNATAIGARKDGVVLIGEGVSLAANRGLPELMERAAAAGARVICLAPADGFSVLPGGDAATRPAVSLGNTEIIAALDKHLDAATWSDGPAVATSWTPDASRRRSEGEWHADTKGWPCIEAKWPGGGRLIYCGFGVIRSWEKTPAARYLLAAILNHSKPTQPNRTGE